jgi:hypothetical protein
MPAMPSGAMMLLREKYVKLLYRRAFSEQRFAS